MKVSMSIFKISNCVLTRECSYKICGNIEIRPYAFVTIIATSDELDNLKDMIFSKLFISQEKCCNCLSELEESVKFNKLVFINTRRGQREFFPDTNQPAAPFQFSLRLDQIPDSFEHNGKTYYFNFLIHHIPGGIGHFESYCPTKDGIWEFDDSAFTEKTVQNNKIVNPVLLVYSIFCTK